MSRLLLALILPALGLVPAAAQPLGPERHLLDVLNAERRARGLSELAWDESLAGIARLHAQDMRAAGIASHDSLRDGSTYAERLDRTGLPATAFAENVALAHGVLQAHGWLMSSPGHRRNVLDPELTHVGLGVEETSDGLAVFVVEDFARLLPELTEDEARQAVREQLSALPRRVDELPLREAPELSGEARRLSREMATTGRSQAPDLPVVEHDVAYFYDTRDPSVLPEMLAEVAPDALDFGLGVTRAARPGDDRLSYWVVVIFRDVL